MIDALRGRGAEVLHVPVLEVAPPFDPGPLQRAAWGIHAWDWVAFTSANGVKALARRLPDGTDVRARVAVVGPGTARTVRELLDVEPVLVPESDYSAAGLLEAFRAGGPRVGPLQGARVLLPLAEAARDVLEEGLAALGAKVQRIVAYRTVAPSGGGVESVRGALSAGEIDLLTFTSPSSAENFLEMAGEAALRAPVAAIGPVTAEAAAELGYRVVAVPEEHTVAALVEASLEWLERDGGRRPARGGAGAG